MSVRSVSGRTVTVHSVDESGTVLDLKRGIEQQLSVPLHLQRIILAGRELSDNAALAANGVVDGAIVQLVVRPDSHASDVASSRMMQEQLIEQNTQDSNPPPVLACSHQYNAIRLTNTHRDTGGCAVHVATEPDKAGD